MAPLLFVNYAHSSTNMQKIVPFLWFDNQVEEALSFYTTVFKDAKVLHRTLVGDRLMSADFLLNGQEFIALNGGPQFKFTEAISLYVKCETQAEIDSLWEQLSAGGEKQRCGWLKDRYGLSWQIVPSVLTELLHSSDSNKSQKVLQAMQHMDKIDIAVLQKAYSEV